MDSFFATFFTSTETSDHTPVDYDGSGSGGGGQYCVIA
jgi:hypothetical protein